MYNRNLLTVALLYIIVNRFQKKSDTFCISELLILYHFIIVNIVKQFEHIGLLDFVHAFTRLRFLHLQHFFVLLEHFLHAKIPYFILE